MVGVCFSVLKSRLVIGWSLLFSEATHVIDEIWSLILGEKNGLSLFLGEKILN